jgi:Chitin synthase export chaperone
VLKQQATTMAALSMEFRCPEEDTWEISVRTATVVTVYSNDSGSILLSFFAIITVLGLLLLAQIKRAAVGRREFQMFLLGYALVSLCEIFSVGHFPLDSVVQRAFSAIHIGAVTATAWLLFLQGVIGFQFVEDGTPLSLGACGASAGALFIGTGYIALDTGFSFTTFWDSTLVAPNQAYALYTLYLLLPLVCIVLFFLLESFLVLRLLGEIRPLCKYHA